MAGRARPSVLSVESMVDVVVVGAGPAGIAAALAARRAGASVTLVDEYAAPGGQIWRRPFAEARAAVPRSLPRSARRLCRELARADVRVLAGTAVWGVEEPRTLLLSGGEDAPARLPARAVVLATGAYDRPVAFPGWTLPGVMTAGAAQALVKGQGVLPGRRVLLAGAGPFLLPVATQLAAGGAEVVAVVEATRRRDWLRAAPRMAAYPGRLAAYAGYRARMARAGTGLVWGHVLTRADGDERVRTATIAAAGADWAPRAGTERTLEVDAVCTAYGFLPAVELARAFGCEMRDHVVAHDGAMRTTVADVLAAGEVTGIGGAGLARIEGEIAGREAALAAARERVGSDGDGELAELPGPRALRRRHARAAGFARVLEDLFAPRPGVLSLADAETPLCRCEDVTAGAVDAAIAGGAATLAALKIVTRCGQGPCQGRVCEGLIAHRLGNRGERERFSSRPPLRPVALQLLMEQEARSSPS